MEAQMDQQHPDHPSGISVAELERGGQRMKAIATNSHRAAENSERAVSLLTDFIQPTGGENGQLSEVVALLTAITETLAGMDARLSVIESGLFAPVTRSRP